MHCVRQMIHFELCCLRLSTIENDMTVHKMLGLISGLKPNIWFLRTLSDFRVYQLSYCKFVAHILSTSIDSFSKELMQRTEYAGVDALVEMNAAIVGRVIKSRKQLKQQMMAFIEALQNGNKYEIVKEEDAICFFL